MFPSCGALINLFLKLLIFRSRFVNFQLKMSSSILVIYYIEFKSRVKLICTATGYVVEGPGSIPGMRTFL